MDSTAERETKNLQEQFERHLDNAGICLYPDEVRHDFDWERFRRYPDEYSAEIVLREAVVILWRLSKRINWDKACDEDGQQKAYMRSLKQALQPLQAARRLSNAAEIRTGDDGLFPLDELVVEAAVARGVYHWLRQVDEWYQITGSWFEAGDYVVTGSAG